MRVAVRCPKLVTPVLAPGPAGGVATNGSVGGGKPPYWRPALPG